jgi:type I restriction-modification system DNA methylase subunit
MVVALGPPSPFNHYALKANQRGCGGVGTTATKHFRNRASHGSLLAKPTATPLSQLSPKIWTLELQTRKKLNARSQATGRALTNMYKTHIHADIATFQMFEIKNYMDKVGMQMQRSLRKTIKEVNNKFLDIVDALDFEFKGQDVIVDGLRYVISKEMKLKDP